MTSVERRKRKRWLSRRRLSLVLALIGFAGLSVFLTVFFDTGKPPQLAPTDTPEDFVDLYLREAKAVQFNERGQLEQRFLATTVDHYRHSGEARIAQPRFAFFDTEALNWHLRADRGAITREGDRVVLSGEVIIHSDDRRHELRTEQLTLLPEREVAQTDRAVTIRTPEGVTEAVGMKAELAIDRIHLLNDVKGRYEIQP